MEKVLHLRNSGGLAPHRKHPEAAQGPLPVPRDSSLGKRLLPQLLQDNLVKKLSGWQMPRRMCKSKSCHASSGITSRQTCFACSVDGDSPVTAASISLVRRCLAQNAAIGAGMNNYLCNSRTRSSTSRFNPSAWIGSPECRTGQD